MPGVLTTCITRVCVCEASVKMNRLTNLKTEHSEMPSNEMFQNELAVPRAMRDSPSAISPAIVQSAAALVS